MSKSCHTKYRDSNGKTKKEIDDMEKDKDFTLHELAKKREAKKDVKAKRKELK